MMRNLLKGLNIMLAPDGGAAGGSADNGTPAAGNADSSVAGAFDAAGADGGKPKDEPKKGNDPGGTNPESEIKLAAWAEQLPPEMRSNAESAAKLAKFPKIGELAKAFLELDAKAANGGIPGEKATAEEVAAFWEKAGRPKTADGYSFAGEKDNEGAVFADAAFKANLTSAQADAMFKNLNEKGAAKLQALQAAMLQAENEATQALAAEFGSKAKEKMELLTRGLAAAGPNMSKLIRQAGLSGNPEVLKAFIHFGEMTAESGAAKGKGAGGSHKSAYEEGSIQFKT